MSQLTTKDIADICNADRRRNNPHLTTITIADLEEAYRTSQVLTAA